MPSCCACGQGGAGWAQRRAWQCQTICTCCGAAMRHTIGCSPAALLWCTMVAQVEHTPLDLLVCQETRYDGYPAEDAAASCACIAASSCMLETPQHITAVFDLAVADFNAPHVIRYTSILEARNSWLACRAGYLFSTPAS